MGTLRIENVHFWPFFGEFWPKVAATKKHFVVGCDAGGNPHPLPRQLLLLMQQQITAAHPPPPTLQCIQLAAPTFNAALLQNGVGQEGWWCTSFPDKGRDPAFDLHGSPPYSSCSTTITSAAVYSCPKSCLGSRL